MNERKSNEDRKEWGYESKEMQLNIVNLDRMQKNQTRAMREQELCRNYKYMYMC